MFKSYIRQSLRILLKNKRFSFINLTGLTISFWSFILVFSWVSSELSFNKSFVQKNNLYQLTIKHSSGILDPNTPYAVAPMLNEILPEILNYSRVIRLSTQLSSSFIFDLDDPINTMAYETDVVMVDSGFFKMFSFDFSSGNNIIALEQPNSVVISSRIAKKYFPEQDPTGKNILMNNSRELTITAVVNIPSNTEFQYDFFLLNNTKLDENWNWRDPSYVLLHPDSDINKLESGLVDFIINSSPFHVKDPLPIKFLSIKKVHLTFGNKTNVLIFSFVAILILFIAAVNHMNLSTSNFSRRIREMGLRKVVGAKRNQLNNFLFLETILQTFIALILALLLAEFTLPFLKDLLGRKIEIGYLDSVIVLPILLGIVFLLSFLASIYPSMVFTRGNPAKVLRMAALQKTKRSRFIIITVIFQFTISIILLTSTLVVLKQLKYVNNYDLGFNVNNIVRIPINDGISRNFNTFIQLLNKHSNITAVTVGQAGPFNEDFKTNLDWVERDEDTDRLFRYSICLPNYIETFEIEIVNGRSFSEDIQADMNKFIINETAVELMRFDDPIGKELTMWGKTGEIIGVVKDYHHVSMHREILPHVFNINPANYRNLRFIYVKFSSENKTEIIDYIKEIYYESVSDFPFSYTFVEDELEKLYKADKNLSLIIGFFSLLALLISCLGIYGLATFSVEQRSKEFAIRKVTGANFANIIYLINKDMIKLMSISIIIAIPVSYFLMSKWLQNFAYHAKIDWSLFIFSGIIVILISIITSFSGVYRTVKKTPAEVIKYE
ncbi:ABC transporter permease [Bacteroidota bacterium]